MLCRRCVCVVCGRFWFMGDVAEAEGEVRGVEAEPFIAGEGARSGQLTR